LKQRPERSRRYSSSGHQIANLRLKANFNEADWAAEQMNGISYIFFLRELINRIENDWHGVRSELEEIRKTLVNRKHMILNLTTSHDIWPEMNSEIFHFVKGFPAGDIPAQHWQCNNYPDGEAIIIPSQVNYVAKGADICAYGYKTSGAVHVITRFLRTSRLWEEVRVKGGAYGVYCTFDRLSGMLTFLSYRDPNIMKTIRAFDDTADFLKMLDINQAELEKSIIGTIGAVDSYLLPDAKGYISMLRRLSGETDEERQQIRDEILSTDIDDFRAFSEFLSIVKDKGIVKVAGSETAITETMKEMPGWLEVVRAL
jgi:Zn-dependent M16 (insulinase) family peptidase